MVPNGRAQRISLTLMFSIQISLAVQPEPAMHSLRRLHVCAYLR